MKYTYVGLGLAFIITSFRLVFRSILSGAVEFDSWDGGIFWIASGIGFIADYLTGRLWKK